jgi:CRP-like cAMP-binding protein
MDRIEGHYIKSLFDKYFEAPVQLWDQFSEKMIFRTFEKNEIIKSTEQTETYIDLIIKGSIGVFMWSDNHNKCLDLFFEEDFSCDFMSFLEGKHTALFTQALEKTEVFSIAKANVNELYEENVIGLKIYRAATESLFIHKQNQQIDLLNKTAEERYQALLDEKPELILRTPSKHIASYLGITPESISRIRKSNPKR